MRFWNNEVLTNMPGILETLLAALYGQKASPHPHPPGETPVGLSHQGEAL